MLENIYLTQKEDMNARKWNKTDMTFRKQIPKWQTQILSFQ